MIPKGRGHLRILLRKAGDRTRCIQLLRHPVKKCHLPRVDAGGILRMYIYSSDKKDVCGSDLTVLVCRGKRHIYPNHKVLRHGHGGPIRKSVTIKKQKKKSSLYSALKMFLKRQNLSVSLSALSTLPPTPATLCSTLSLAPAPLSLLRRKWDGAGLV